MHDTDGRVDRLADRKRS